jgi:hypothetical protein
MRTLMQNYRDQIAEHLADIEEILPGYKLTLIARNTNPKYPDADLFLTSEEDVGLAVKAIEHLLTSPTTSEVPL